MGDERREGNKEVLFILGQVHEQCKRIPEIEKKMEQQDEKIDTCRNTSRVVQTAGAFSGGILGGFIAVIVKKFAIG